MKIIKIEKLVSLLLLFALISCGKPRKEALSHQENNSENTFKVVGYMFSDGNLDLESAKLDFDKITHLNIAFINPDIHGAFTAPVGLIGAIKRAQQNKVKVLFSFAGGNPPVYLKNLVKPENNDLLIKNMVEFADKYNFDGIDVDLEGDFIDANYEAFITKLSNLLEPKKKLLTAAVATWNGEDISNKALSKFDFISIMAYDHTGPWNKSNPGPHSTYQSAVEDFNYWNITRSVAAGRLVLGLPFYGYGFGANIQESLNYTDIVSTYAGSSQTDSVVVPNKGTIYYNGIPTIKKKVNFALTKNAGGVMIWQLFGDAGGEYSLLSVINQTKQ